MNDDPWSGETTIVVPIEDFIDLHTFSPRDVPELLDAYFEACREKGLLDVRVIHGKGEGFLREKVHGCLRRSGQVVSYEPAPPERGGWGATMVRLKP